MVAKGWQARRSPRKGKRVSDEKILSLVKLGELKLPEAVRRRLLELYRARQTAELALQGPTATALEFLGLDPMLPHQINFDTGIVTPAESPNGVLN